MFDRMLSFVVAVGLALLVWTYARSSDKVYEVQQAPIHFLCPTNFPLRPIFLGLESGCISVRVRGPARKQPPQVYAFVDLTQGHYATPGRYHEPIQIQLPKEFELVQEPLRGVSFQLASPDRTNPAP